MTRLGKSLLSLSFLLTFGAGFMLSYTMYPPHVKPPVPMPGPISISEGYIDGVGGAACFDEESFSNLVTLLVEMGNEFE